MDEVLGDAPSKTNPAEPESRFARLLAQHVLDRPRGDPDDDLAVLSRQLLRADEVIAATRDSWGKAEARRDVLEHVSAELLAALEALRGAVVKHPDFQGREYVGLGIQVNNAIERAGRFHPTVQMQPIRHNARDGASPQDNRNPPTPG